MVKVHKVVIDRGDIQKTYQRGQRQVKPGVTQTKAGLEASRSSSLASVQQAGALSGLCLCGCLSFEGGKSLLQFFFFCIHLPFVIF